MAYVSEMTNWVKGHPKTAIGIALTAASLGVVYKLSYDKSRKKNGEISRNRGRQDTVRDYDPQKDIGFC